MNHKRVYRIMKKKGLLLQRYTGRPVRVPDGRIRMLRSHLHWRSDTFEMTCWNGEWDRVTFSMDCCGREIMGLSYVPAMGGICGEMIKDLKAEAMEARFGLLVTSDMSGFVAHNLSGLL